MTRQDEEAFQSSIECHICERRFRAKDLLTLEDGVTIMNKVRDHCHITGKYRGAAHQHCNLKWSLSSEKMKIPVVFHNLKGYDCHLIMQKLGRLIEEDQSINVGVIAQNFEKYLGFNLDNLKFIDSFSFMPQSLGRLSSNLATEKFVYTREAFPDLEKFNLVTKKGVYPYDYMDSFSRFKHLII